MTEQEPPVPQDDSGRAPEEEATEEQAPQTNVAPPGSVQREGDSDSHPPR
jgi:hypothetical protein